MKKSNVIRDSIILAGVAAILCGIGFYILGDDMPEFLRWWLMVLLLGIAFLPSASIVFSKFTDKGWLFSKTIGIAFCAWLMWFLSSLRIMKFTVVNCYICIALIFIINAAIWAAYYIINKNKENIKQNSVFTFEWSNIKGAIVCELIFFAMFLFWTYLRGCKPEAYGTEKFMDYGFMTSMMRSEYMPPNDMWLSGSTINYYYVGQYIGVFITKAAGIEVGYGYNFMLMMLAAFAFALPYSLVYQIAKNFTRTKIVRQGKNEIKENVVTGKVFPVVSGAVAGTAVCFAGNMHYPFFNWLPQSVIEFFGFTYKESYWFPDATRFIGYNPENNDKTIHEFPCYSFVLGDLHAHVINIMFVITVLALLYAFLLARRNAMDAVRLKQAENQQKPNFIKEIFRLEILLIGFFIGLFHMTNYWDYPIYFVVSGAIILFSNAVIYKFNKNCLFLTAAHAVVILLISMVTAWPFTASFQQMSTSIALCVNHSSLMQLIILWGLPTSAVAAFAIVLYKKQPKVYRSRNDLKNNTASIDSTKVELTGENKNWLYRFITSLQISDLFVLTIGLCAIGLVLIPEIVYVVDIYSGSYKRANTMFKLTYQSFIMFGMCMGYIICRFVRYRESKAQRNYGIIAAFLLFATLCYFFKASDSWFGDYKNLNTYKGIDASAFVKDESIQDYYALQWLNENAEDDAIVAEEPGLSYTYLNRVSVITGLSTVIGWETHEWLWRSESGGGKPSIIPERQADMATLYTSTDLATVVDIIEKYGINYIYVGEGERVVGTSGKTSSDKTDEHTVFYIDRYYIPQDVNDELLRGLGDIVYEYIDEDGDNMTNGEYNTYIIKINYYENQ